MIPVAEAVARITAAFAPLPAETVSIAEAFDRVLAEDLRARVTQPPVDVSAMDGYAVRATDVAEPPVTLRLIGSAPAGERFAGTVAAGQTVRIFTGGPVPDGADAIVMQENVEADGERITIKESAASGRFVRPAGLDFKAGDVGLVAGRRMTPRAIGFAAAMNLPWLRVRRRPRIAILATGDEIVMPGDPVGANQIVSSNSLALAAAVQSYGGEPLNLGIAPDDRDALRAMAESARGADLLVTTGGASVGEHDLIQSVLGEAGLELDFWKIAMRPGKPLMFGRFGETGLLGLPGNPVSSLVCALVFLRPAMDAMLGATEADAPPLVARTERELGANDERQDYQRATLALAPDGALTASPYSKQDSSMLSMLAGADCLIVRPPHAPAIPAGGTVEVLPLDVGRYRL